MKRRAQEHSRTRRAVLPVGLCLLLSAGSALAAGVPPDWSATSLDRCDREPFHLRPALSADALQQQFAAFSLRLARDARVSGASAQWDFTALEGTTEAPLALSELPPVLDGLALWLKNPQGRALSLVLRATDGVGATFDTPPQSLETASRWTQYFLALTDLRGPGGEAARLPLSRLQIVLTGVPSRQACTIYLDEIESFAAPLPELRVGGLQAPSQAAAGVNLAVEWTLQAGAAVPRPVTVVARLERDGSPVALAEVVASPEALAGRSPVRLRAELPLPRHMANGAYRLRLTSSQAKLSGELGRDVEVAGQTQPTKAATRQTSQGGSFVVDGRALPIIGGWQTLRQPCSGAAWVLVHLTADLSADGEPLAVWKGREQYDFTGLDMALARALAANPEAYLLPVIHLEAPEWWKAEHPKDVMVYGNGKPELPAGVPSFTRTHASWASTAWREDCGQLLAQIVRHLEAGPLGPAIMGYQLAAGEGGYWAYPGASHGVYADYSAPQQEAFRAWLKRKYGDLKSLRVAWGQPAAPVTTPEGLKESQAVLGWNQARVPSQTLRAQGSQGVLHDPTGSQEVVDYQVFASDLVVETIRLLARDADKAAGEGKMVGVEYGLLFDLAGTACGLQNGGHLALGPLAQAEELDFVASPSTSGAVGGPPLITTTAATFAQHGKLWMGLAEAERGLGGAVLPLCGGGVLAQEGFSPAAWPERLTTLLSGAERSGVSEIAVVVDDISAAYMACGGELSKPLLSDQRVGVSLIGAPCDVWMLDDVISGRAPRYKLYIFLNAFYLDGNSRLQLVQALNAEPCTALWVYCPGGIDQAVGGRIMKDLTGLTLAQRPGKGPVKVKVLGDPSYTYGAPEPFFPRFACVDDQADVRGHLVGTELGGLAAKAYGQIRSIWSAAPHLPASLLRDIAVEAGVALYADNGDGLYACRDLLAVRAATAEQKIRLRQPSDVYDLVSGKLVAQQASEFRPGLAPGAVGLYYLSEPR